MAAADANSNSVNSTIKGSAATRIHPTVGYVGIRPLERMPTAGEATRFEVLALTQEGSRAERMATKLEVVKRTWNRTREKGMDGRWRMVSTLEEQTVFEELPISSR